jgi:hypothetical protein
MGQEIPAPLRDSVCPLSLLSFCKFFSLRSFSAPHPEEGGKRHPSLHPGEGRERRGYLVLSPITTKVDIGDNGDIGSCCATMFSLPLSPGRDGGDDGLQVHPNFKSIFVSSGLYSSMNHMPDLMAALRAGVAIAQFGVSMMFKKSTSQRALVPELHSRALVVPLVTSPSTSR